MQIIIANLPEERSQDIKRWIDNYLPHMHREDLKNNKKFVADLKRGIPIEVRGEAWSGFIGNDLRINFKLYESLLVRVSYAETNIDEDD